MCSFRRLMFDVYCHLRPGKMPQQVFQAEGQRLLALAERLPHEFLTKRVSAAVPWEVEAGPRDWSVGMVLAHLVDSGAAFAECIRDLGRGKEPAAPVDFTTIHPRGGDPLRIVHEYRRLLQDYARAAAGDLGRRGAGLTHPHPYFGELSGHGWLCLAALHQTIHRRHVEQIIPQLGIEPRWAVYFQPY
jgi:hypothetical protein